MAVVVLIRVGQHYEWTGFGETVQPKPDEQEIWPRKTLWDWLQLLIVPLALIVIGFWFTVQQDTRQQRIEDQRAAAERELAVQRAQDEALQAYLNQMGSLLLEKDLRNSEKDSEVRTLARARTVTVIQRLDSDRNSNVIRFLHEAGLIGKGESSIRLLAEADLRGAHLQGLDLREADLSYANLSYADLRGAYLYGTDLREANLTHAHLNGANLAYSDLSWASLRHADLSKAGLFETDLSYAILERVDLSGADLSGATSWTEEQLKQAASLKDVTMPDGQTLKSYDNPDRPTFEEWLKSKGRESDGQNSGAP